MKKLITFILSNDFDYLFQQLKAILYSKSNILTRKLLVMPGDETLRIFEKNCLCDPKIALNFGYRPLNLNLAMEVLAKTVIPEAKFPKKKAIKQILIEKISEKLRKQDQNFSFLRNYLDGSNALHSFFEILAQNFINYGFYGIKEEIKESLIWQKILFDELKDDFDWPIDLLSKDLNQPELLAGMELHLFGMTMIPPLYLEFLKKISRYVPIYFYYLYPSQEYAIDFMHDGLKAAFIDYDMEKNPLLANFQTALKPTMKFLIDEANYHKEGFFVGKRQYNEIIQYPDFLPNLRSAVLSNLVEAKTLHSLEKTMVDVDDCFLIFIAPYAYREVEHMVSFLKKEISTRKLKYEHIVILCADILSYSPLISYHMEKNKIPYQIDSSLYLCNTEDQEILILLDFIDCRYEKEDILLLLSCEKLFYRLQITSKELTAIRKIIEESSITFAFDRNHRKEILGNCSIKDISIGTVEHFFEQIYLGRVFSHKQLQNSQFGASYESLDQRLLVCFSLLHQLLEDLYSLKISLKDAKTFKCFFVDTIEIMKKYFSEEYLYSIRNDFQEEIECSLDLGYLGEIFISQLKQKIQSRKAGLSSLDDEKVVCSDFYEGSFIGKKWVYFLGLDEVNFPKLELENSLDISENKNKITSLQIQKANFLQLLGSNIDYIYFSYSKLGLDNKERIGSLYLEKFLQMVDTYFCCEDNVLPSKKMQKIISSVGYCPTNLSVINYDKIAHRYYLETKKPKDSQVIQKIEKEKNSIIRLTDLQDLLTNPVRFFVKNSLDLFFPFKEEHKEFHLATFQQKKMLIQSCYQEFDLLFQQWRYRGKLPQYGFAKAYEQSLQRSMENLKKERDLKKENFNQRRSFILQSGKKLSEKIEDQKLLVPAISVETDCGKYVEIVGKIEEFQLGVLLLPVETKKEEMFRFWANILAYNDCSKLCQEEEWKLVGLTLNEKNVTLLSSEKYWKDLIKYYFLALEQVSFFYDFSAKKIIKENSISALNEFIKKEKQGDLYFSYFPPNEVNLEMFLDAFKNIYSAYENWFEGK